MTSLYKIFRLGIRMKIKDMMYISLFAAVIAVLGLVLPIPVLFTPVPITAIFGACRRCFGAKAVF